MAINMYEYIIYGAFALLCGTSLIIILNNEALPKVHKGLTIVLVPLISLSVYHIVGSPTHHDVPMSERQHLLPFIMAESQLLLERPLLTALQEAPENVKLWQQLVEIYIAAGRLTQAASTLRDAYQSTNDSSFQDRLQDILAEMPELKTAKD